MALTEKLGAIGDAIRAKTGGTELLTLDAMPTAIESISGAAEPVIEALEVTSNGTYTASNGVDGYSPITVNVPQDGSPPESAFVISGSCLNWDYNGDWDSFITAYADKWSTSNIDDCSYMFYSSKLSSVPFDINLDNGKHPIFTSMFAYSNITTLPTIIGNNIAIQSTNSFLSNSKIKNIANDYFNFISDIYSTYANCSSMFQSCKYLRNFPTSVNIITIKLKTTSAYNSLYSNMCYYCYVLDEITNLAVNTTITYTSNTFSNIVMKCSRLKNFTFETGKTVNWKNQTIDLSNSVGYGLRDTDALNADIPTSKKVYDDATYQALKNDPDWFTTNVAYSRYNHDSAVATINSLPDTSAYLASAGGTNTIKFNGAAGSATDGGAINTLTEEEIAVATAKGWTCSFV